MSRFLVGTIPVLGHVSPMLPIVARLVQRGHEVWWYTGKLFQAQVEALGARFVAMERAIDYSVVDEVPPEWPSQRAKLSGLAKLRFDLKHFFIDHAVDQVHDYQAILADFPVDLLLSDSFFLGAAWMHEKGGPPWAQLGVSVMAFDGDGIAPFGLGLQPNQSRLGQLRDRALGTVVTAALRGIRQDIKQARQLLGLPDNRLGFFDTVSPYLYLAATVPGFEYPRRNLPAQVKFIGPPQSRISTMFKRPNWWNDLQSDCSVVHVTQGTISTEPTDLLLPTLEALKDETVLIVATTGNQPVEVLGDARLQANVRAAQFIPYAELLPHVDVIVTNGGYNGVQKALSHGIPLVAAGESEDKPEVCARIAWSGVGLNLKTQRPKPQQIQAAVREILTQPQYRQRARALQAEIGQYSSAELATCYLEQLIETDVEAS